MNSADSHSIPVLTIDGPSGSGKGTVSRLIAQRLGWHFLDSGALYRAVGPAGSKLRRAGEISLTTPGLDLAARLRVFQRALRSRVERRDALIEIVRAVNATLEPERIAEHLVERGAQWIPAPCWAVVSADQSGQLSVRADRGLMPDMGPAVYAIAGWVMSRGQEFVTRYPGGPFTARIKELVDGISRAQP